MTNTRMISDCRHCHPPACFPRPPRRLSRRGSVYVLVLGVSTMLMVVGLGVIAVSRADTARVTAARDWTEAGVAARSGVEFVLAALNENTGWRSGRTSGAVFADLTLGRARVVCRVVDEADSDLENNSGDPVRISAEASVGGAKRRFSVAAEIGGGGGLDLLRTAMHAGGALNTATAAAAGGPVSTSARLTNTLVLTADVEAGSITNSGTIMGNVTMPAPAKTMPAWSGFSALSARATQIRFGDIPGGAITDCVLSAGDNPYGAKSSEGVYIIQVPLLSRLEIHRARLKASLIVTLGAGASLEVFGEVLWEPARPDLPTLVVRSTALSTVTLKGSAATLKETDVSVSLNPPTTPYLSGSDNDTTDTYPSEIQGAIFTSGLLTTLNVGTAVSIKGCVVADGPATLGTGARLRADPTLLANPPLGFATGATRTVTAVPGSWVWEVDP